MPSCRINFLILRLKMDSFYKIFVFLVICVLLLGSIIYRFQFSMNRPSYNQKNFPDFPNQHGKRFLPALANKKLVLVVGQMRVGSSFTAGLFEKNEDALYIFEPLESVYQYLYGSQPEFAIPVDLFFHRNKTRRYVTYVYMLHDCKYMHTLNHSELDAKQYPFTFLVSVNT